MISLTFPAVAGLVIASVLCGVLLGIAIFAAVYK